jgi:hypothetical protein
MEVGLGHRGLVLVGLGGGFAVAAFLGLGRCGRGGLGRLLLHQVPGCAATAHGQKQHHGSDDDDELLLAARRHGRRGFGRFGFGFRGGCGGHAKTPESLRRAHRKVAHRMVSWHRFCGKGPFWNP